MCEYLLQVWYRQQLLQLGQELVHEMLQSLVIFRVKDFREEILQGKASILDLQ